MAERKKLWELDKQTEGKHLVLRHYLDGWFPILGRWHKSLLFVDGFAGPGEYVGGERGSPMVALDCIAEHKRKDRLAGVEIECLFMESRADRSEHLRNLVAAYPSIPETTPQVLEGPFEDHMTRILKRIEDQNAVAAPCFVMVDPFGPKGAPMELIGRVLDNDRSECLISFMYEPIRRFREIPEHTHALNQLFGTQEWRLWEKKSDEASAKQFLHDLFAKQLRRHGARYVIPFELWRGNRHVYTLYFATGAVKGCDVMKRSIWKIDPSGGFSFRGYVHGQLTLFDASTEPLADQLSEQFGHDWVPIEEIDAFVMSDQTPFHSGHLRQKTLQPLEREGRIEVDRPNGGKGFPPKKDVRVRFA